VKRAIFAGVFLAVLMLVWSSSLTLGAMLAKKDLSLVQMQIQSRTNAYEQVKVNIRKVADVQRKLNALQQLNTGRFLEGNLLNALQQISLSGVQLTRMRVDQNYSFKEGSPGQTNQFGVIAGRPAADLERIVLTMDAKDYSDSPGDQINKFKDAFTSQSYFQAVLDKTNGVRLASSPSASQAGPDGKAFVLFTLECLYPVQTR
jgi:hypothetical protein